ncbi:MAG TPA: helix-turn-helix domain-containing protein [Streptosporangiaceae bacterium]|nr:helix-turn-helix domain-containing protein [Streptosporangiaceae bacterium]
MTRASAESRLQEIAQAGARCFAHLGYRRTRMAEVAAAAGLSTGAVYTYVESKESLLHLVLAAGLGLPAADLGDLPLSAPDIAVTVEMVGRGLTRQGTTPLLKAAVAADTPQDVRTELAAVVAEQYSTVERLRGVLSVIEACAADLPPLEALYFGRRRRGRIDLLRDYLQRRAASGHLRSLPDMAVAAQIVTETVAWFAWKRHESRDASRFDDNITRATVVEFVCNALLPEQAAT